MLEHAYSRMTIILVGNKKDLESEREVSYEEGAEFAKKNKLIFFETSAKTAENVEATFISATKMIFQNIQKGNVYDLANEAIGIKPGNALPPAHGKAFRDGGNMKYNIFASIDKSYDWANLPSLPILNDKTP